ncbi:MAG: hypothetical protein K8T91_10755 [Planctomycetes bacterium]|nr:hypothetical protein [Planctomycetota bacterium]
MSAHGAEQGEGAGDLAASTAYTYDLTGRLKTMSTRDATLMNLLAG